jgi:CheY-like chemotaxis protein
MWWKKKKAKVDAAALQRRKTVMLVDDDLPLRQCIGTLLEREGYTVVTCVDGLDAVNKYREQHAGIGLVLLDMKMPNMDGRAAFHELRKIDSKARVILCSGFSVDVMVKECLDAGALEFLTKPFQTFMLLEVIAKHIADA